MAVNNTPADNEEKPQVISARQARGGYINSRVITVLIVSLLLAVIVMGIFMSIDWRW